MPFNIDDSLNNCADKFLNAPFVYGIISSPIYTGLLIVLIIVIIFTYSYDIDFDSELVKPAFYIMIAVMGALFLHDRVLLSESTSAFKNAEVNDLFVFQNAQDANTAQINVAPESIHQSLLDIVTS